MKIEDVARTCHEANRIYCQSHGDLSQPTWDGAPDWQKQSAMGGVRFHMLHPNSNPADSHANWLKQKVDEGWKFGPVKDPDKKEHPCIMPYECLPLQQQYKDHLFIAIVRALEPSIEDAP